VGHEIVASRHALCWVHAERLVHRLDTFTDLHRKAQQRLRALIWWFYADLKAYCAAPTARLALNSPATSECRLKTKPPLDAADHGEDYG